MRRRRRPASDKKKQNHEGTWAISYGDMITLLLGFFVLFYSTEPIGKGDAQLTESLIERMKDLDKDLVVNIDDTVNKKEKSKQTQTARDTAMTEDTALKNYSAGLFDTVWSIFFGDRTQPYQKSKVATDQDTKGENRPTEVKLTAKEVGTHMYS